VIAGIEIHSAATKPVPPPILKCLKDYFDEAWLLHSQPEQQLGLKLVDAATGLVSKWRVDYPRVLHEKLIAESPAISEPAVVASATLAPPAYILFSSTQSTSDSAHFTRPTANPLDGYDRFKERNWDGYDAEPITAETLRYARRLLGAMPDTFGPPDIAPSGDGSIGLEWVPGDGPLDRLFLDIGPGEEWRAYWKRRNGEFGRLPGTGFDSQTTHILQKLFADLRGLPDVTVGR